MNYLIRATLTFLCLVSFLPGAFGAVPEASGDLDVRIDWPEFMSRHDPVYGQLPDRWEEAPYFGNGMLGSMLYKDGGENALRLQVFRMDVQDHRDNTAGWTAYSRPRFIIGSFRLHPIGELTGCQWRQDLWNAELTGVIQTTEGEIEIRHFIHTDKMVMVTELTPSEGEEGFTWSWHPHEAKTTRGGVPRTQEDIEEFANRYGEHYRDKLRIYEPNPPHRLEREQGVDACVQDLLVGGQYATAWKDAEAGERTRVFYVSIEKSYPKRTAKDEAVAAVRDAEETGVPGLLGTHRAWWRDYYPESFVSIPDTRLETFYWHQIYKLACATRSHHMIMDTAGPWIQPTPWPYITWDLNVQLCYWMVYPSNRLHLGEPLVNSFHENKQTLINNVLPKKWREDSAFLNTTTAQDLIEPRNGDMRYYYSMGNLTWALHDCFLHYRFSMDKQMLREKIFPLLKRSVNMYIHMLEEDEEGRLHIKPTYSPEYPRAGQQYDGPENVHSRDGNYDLALLRWGCKALLESCEDLNIDDPLIAKWKDVLDRLVDYPTNENGYMIGRDLPVDWSHRHYSHLLMIYPLHLVNIEQEGAEEVMDKSLERWINLQGGLAGYSWTGASAMSAALGRGEDALKYLKGLERYLQPNGLYQEAGPCMETPLSGGQCIHDMLIQSWGDNIRVFPAMPSDWADAVFHNLRAEGAFLVSASRKDGETEFVRIRSFAGEPCRLQTDMPGPLEVVAGPDIEISKLEDGVYELGIEKGEEVTLAPEGASPDLTIGPTPAEEAKLNSFGLAEVMRAPKIEILERGQDESVIDLAARNPNAEVRYTTDGGEPDSDSELFQRPVKLSKGKVLKARAFKEGLPPSTVASFTAGALRINFQPRDVSIPEGFQPDYGEAFGERPSDLQYGWSGDHTEATRRRRGDSPESTLCHFHDGAHWELALADGEYRVKVCMGDFDHDTAFTLNVEGVNYCDDMWIRKTTKTITKVVNIQDGRLTIDNGDSTQTWTKMNFIEIVEHNS